MARRGMLKLSAIAFVVAFGFSLSYSMVGFPFSLIFLVVCFDSLMIRRVIKMGIETGIELATFATVLAAVFYGPWMALAFGVFLVPIITGVLGMMMWGFSPMDDFAWTPLVPSPDTLVIGISGFLVGLVYSQFSILILAGAVMAISRTILHSAKELLMSGNPRIFAYIVNSILTIALVVSVEEIISLI